MRRLGITRAHIEEDAGKLVHAGAASLSGSDYSLVGARAGPVQGLRREREGVGLRGRFTVGLNPCTLLPLRYLPPCRLKHGGGGARPNPTSPVPSPRPAPQVDYNRAGVPLLEIVSEPDMRTGAEAAAYGAELRRIMRFLDVSGEGAGLGTVGGVVAACGCDPTWLQPGQK